MNNPKEIKISDYTYDLPVDRIAKYPSAQRDASKLLVYENGSVREDIFKNLPGHIPSESMLVFNDTKVIEARILFQKPTGGVIELFCLEPFKHIDPLHALQSKEKVKWKCMVGGASKWKHGPLQKQVFVNKKDINEIFLQAEVTEKTEEAFIIEFSWQPAEFTFAEVLHYTGAVPLPPYIKREAEQADAEKYQTVYAREEGSVAAPTAGLHFTKSLLESLKQKNIGIEFLTLHVGAGTFKPVKSEIIGDHIMHEEWIEIDRELVKELLNDADRKIIAVGTTSLRSLESMYWIGVKILQNRVSKFNDLHVSQWDPYENAKEISAQESLQGLQEWMNKRDQEKLVTQTQLLIAPGYDFKIADGLITNFHQPSSTLLLLVAAFAGSNWKTIYEYALAKDFRFLSYGDGSLLWNCKTNEH